MISKALVVGSYQTKAEELAKLPGLELMVVTPPAWVQEGKPIRLQRSHTHGYELAVEPMALNGHFHVHWYPLLRRRFAGFRPDIVHIDEEAYNLSTFQAMLLCRQYGARSRISSPGKTWTAAIHSRFPPSSTTSGGTQTSASPATRSPRPFSGAAVTKVKSPSSPSLGLTRCCSGDYDTPRATALPSASPAVSLSRRGCGRCVMPSNSCRTIAV